MSHVKVVFGMLWMILVKNQRLYRNINETVLSTKADQKGEGERYGINSQNQRSINAKELSAAGGLMNILTI
jgi:hypothetical protein